MLSKQTFLFQRANKIVKPQKGCLENVRIKWMCRCIIIYGDISNHYLARLSSSFGAQALVSHGLARDLNASFVIGEPLDIQRLERQLHFKEDNENFLSSNHFTIKEGFLIARAA